MKYKKINEVINQINNIQGNSEEKVIKKLVKFIEKLKPYQEDYSNKVQELRLDNAATDKDGVLILTEKGDYKFNKEGIKKLGEQLKELGEKEFEFKPIEVINTNGLENFTFLENWTTGITFIKEEEEEL
jgi:polyhydroxyalkanoate synthesis regulator phasin